MKIFDEKAIIARVKLLRQQHSGSRGKSEFARLLGISPSTYSYYESSRIPPIEILLKICEVTGADLNWLLAGSGTEEKSEFGLKTKHAAGLNPVLLRKLDDLLGENPELAEPISAFIELLHEQKELKGRVGSKFTQLRTNRPGWIPILGRTAAGMVHFWDQTLLPEPGRAVTELDELVKKHIGKAIVGSADGTMSIDLQTPVLLDGLSKRRANLIQVGGNDVDQVVEFVECEDIIELFPDSFALRIDGDSMSPRINDGDIIILSPSVPAAQGQIGVARVANQIGATCKLIRSEDKAVHLIPINERYETKVVAKKDLLWALAVLCHISV